MHSFLVGSFIIASCAIGGVARLVADDALSNREGESLERKLALIMENAVTEAGEPRLTTVTEQEVNAYFMFQGSDRIPAGVTEARLTIEGEGRLSGQATVDLDQMRRQNAGGWLDPISYLRGRLPIAATGVLFTANGIGRLDVERVTVAGVLVPTRVLFEIVSYYSRTSDDPDGVKLDDPFELPSRIREIRLGTGEAVIVQ